MSLLLTDTNLVYDEHDSDQKKLCDTKSDITVKNSHRLTISRLQPPYGPCTGWCGRVFFKRRKARCCTTSKKKNRSHRRWRRIGCGSCCCWIGGRGGDNRSSCRQAIQADKTTQRTEDHVPIFGQCKPRSWWCSYWLVACSCWTPTNGAASLSLGRQGFMRF